MGPLRDSRRFHGNGYLHGERGDRRNENLTGGVGITICRWSDDTIFFVSDRDGDGQLKLTDTAKNRLRKVSELKGTTVRSSGPEIARAWLCLWFSERFAQRLRVGVIFIVAGLM